ncbi:MAG: hypothetical protein P4L79_17315 [Legionella sp.]|uniref:hypothetical protein n=1 Tax=Legionella sp. TaxID=459 RepID=UPI00284679FD|nr:hypothetical protein [Legionella sp.]
MRFYRVPRPVLKKINEYSNLIKQFSKDHPKLGNEINILHDYSIYPGSRILTFNQKMTLVNLLTNTVTTFNDDDNEKMDQNFLLYEQLIKQLASANDRDHIINQLNIFMYSIIRLRLKKLATMPDKQEYREVITKLTQNTMAVINGQETTPLDMHLTSKIMLNCHSLIMDPFNNKYTQNLNELLATQKWKSHPYLRVIAAIIVIPMLNFTWRLYGLIDYSRVSPIDNRFGPEMVMITTMIAILAMGTGSYAIKAASYSLNFFKPEEVVLAEKMLNIAKKQCSEVIADGAANEEFLIEIISDEEVTEKMCLE